MAKKNEDYQDTQELLQTYLSYPPEVREAAFSAIQTENFLRDAGFTDGVEAFVDRVYDEEYMRRYKSVTTKPLQQPRPHTFCPVDVRHKIRKAGRTANGQQRYECCEETCPTKRFLENHSALIPNPKKNLPKWYLFADALIEGHTIEHCAKVVGISSPTAIEWRNTIFYALDKLVSRQKLSGNIEADETFIRKSLKGDSEALEEENRKAHKRGSAVHNQQRDSQFICVLCAVDDSGHVFARVACVGAPSSDALIACMGDSIDYPLVDHFLTDGENAMAKFAKLNGMDHIPLPPVRYKGYSNSYAKTVSVDGQKFSIQHVNSLHSRLKQFLSTYKGVSSKYLQGYINAFVFRELYVGSPTSRTDGFLELLKILCTPGLELTPEEMAAFFTVPVYEKKPLAIFKDVPENERWAYYLRFVKGETLKSIYDKYGYSPRTLNRIKKSIEDRGLASRVVAWCKREEREEREAIAKRAKRLGRQHRDEQILMDYRANVPISDIAAKNGLTRQRIEDILKVFRDQGEPCRIKKKVLPDFGKRPPKKVRDERLMERYFELRPEYPWGTRTALYERLSKEFPELNPTDIGKRIVTLHKRFGYKRRRHPNLTPEDDERVWNQFCKYYESGRYKSKGAVINLVAGQNHMNPSTVWNHIQERFKEKYTE